MARPTRSSHWHTQNFLRDPALARRLVAGAALVSSDVVVEIGAGSGTITTALAARCRSVLATEIDDRLAAALRRRFAGRTNVSIRHRDFLAERLPDEPYKVFASPPFDITSAIVSKLVRARRPPDDAFLVVQREAARRYCGVPEETLAALLLKPSFEPSIIHRFERTDFFPAPSVEVAMLRLRKRGPPLVQPEDAQLYRDFVVAVVTAWRPTLGSALGRAIGPQRAVRLLAAARADPAIRPTRVPFVAWLALFEAFARAPAAVRDRVIGSEIRLLRQQARLTKQHRTRAPRDALGDRVSMGAPAAVLALR